MNKVDKFLEESIDKKVDERGEQLLSGIYKRVFRIADMMIALVVISFFILSLYKEVSFSGKEVAIILALISFTYNLVLKYSIKKANILEK